MGISEDRDFSQGCFQRVAGNLAALVPNEWSICPGEFV